MRVRKVDANGDFSFGANLNDYYIDVPAAPAQAVNSRLALNLGEWFLDTSDGTDWAGSVLGKYTQATRDLVIQQRVLGTPGVNDIVTGSYSSTINPATRAFSCQMTIDTAYGEQTVAIPPNTL